MILLDTNAFIWLGNGDPLRERERAAVRHAIGQGHLVVSAVTAWEFGTLLLRGRVRLSSPMTAWFATALSRLHARRVDLTIEIALEPSQLPDWDHRDPGDRLLVATARILDVPLVTRDEHILAYAEAGHVRAIAC